MKDLIEKLERTAGQDWPLNAKIAIVAGWTRVGTYDQQGYRDWKSPDGNTVSVTPPDFTGSIDAALTLIPEKLPEYSEINISIEGDRSVTGVSIDVRGEYSIASTVSEGGHATPAIAICIAALKARSA